MRADTVEHAASVKAGSENSEEGHLEGGEKK